MRSFLHRLFVLFVQLVGVALTLASVLLLLRMTVETELLEEALHRNLAIAGTLIAGIILLVGSVYISTRITVFLIAEKRPTTFSNVRPDPTEPPPQT
ncbi:MAG TPA: hypothetical protein VMJ75_13335 [Candidatus Acidoferrales bacterium]|nr:hypothetical protein [Candidatus Acidoferrales bacterium]